MDLKPVGFVCRQRGTLYKLSGFWDKRAELFKDGSNSTGLRTQASRKLTEEVKKLWSQGKSDYNFIINLDSGPKLSLAIEDNTGNFDSPSSRSLGYSDPQKLDNGLRYKNHDKNSEAAALCCIQS